MWQRRIIGVPQDQGSSLLMLFFFHYFTLFVNIVLLNVLIAIISDSYERVQEKFKARSLLQRAQLLLEMEEVRLPIYSYSSSSCSRQLH